MGQNAGHFKDIASNLPKPGKHVALYWVQDSNEVIWILGFWRIQIRKGLMSYTLRRGIEMETIGLFQNAKIKQLLLSSNTHIFRC